MPLQADLGLIRETLINTALELAYYIQADIVAYSNKFVVLFSRLWWLPNDNFRRDNLTGGKTSAIERY